MLSTYSLYSHFFVKLKFFSILSKSYIGEGKKAIISNEDSPGIIVTLLAA